MLLNGFLTVHTSRREDHGRIVLVHQFFGYCAQQAAVRVLSVRQSICKDLETLQNVCSIGEDI